MDSRNAMISTFVSGTKSVAELEDAVPRGPGADDEPV